jgi:predicted secreted hydrolase
MPDTLEELLALEREIEREWWWLNGALHAVAQLQADGPQPNRFREMQAQAREVDRRRTQIAMRIAAEAGRSR